MATTIHLPIENLPSLDFEIEQIYQNLDENEKLDVAEFIDFVCANPDSLLGAKFHLRDHTKRPDTTCLSVPENIPARWDELEKSEQSLVKWFIDTLKNK